MIEMTRKSSEKGKEGKKKRETEREKERKEKKRLLIHQNPALLPSVWTGMASKEKGSRDCARKREEK